MEISNIAFVNITGYTTGGKGNQTASCSTAHPCYNIALRNISLGSVANGAPYPPQGTCTYIAPGCVSEMNGRVVYDAAYEVPRGWKHILMITRRNNS